MSISSGKKSLIIRNVNDFSNDDSNAFPTLLFVFSSAIANGIRSIDSRYFIAESKIVLNIDKYYQQVWGMLKFTSYWQVLQFIFTQFNLLPNTRFSLISAMDNFGSQTYLTQLLRP